MRLRQFAGSPNQCLMAQMHAIEISDRDYRTSARNRHVVVMAKDLHLRLGAPRDHDQRFTLDRNRVAYLAYTIEQRAALLRHHFPHSAYRADFVTDAHRRLETG